MVSDMRTANLRSIFQSSAFMGIFPSTDPM
jgi:hypothetical protein